MKYLLEGNCYVLVRTQVIHPITYDRHDFVWYPEESLSLISTMNYRPFMKSIVTESPWLIALYDRTKVWIVAEDGQWRNPPDQTYGASVNGIMKRVLRFNNTIPAQVLDGGSTLNKRAIEIEKRYKLAERGDP